MCGLGMGVMGFIWGRCWVEKGVCACVQRFLGPLLGSK
jgi:hypothetical protein